MKAGRAINRQPSTRDYCVSPWISSQIRQCGSCARRPRALDCVDAAAKQKVNANNKSLDVSWEKSYANADKTKTYCVYTGPSEAAVREAAKLNGLPVDVVTEIPVDIKAEPRGAVQQIDAGQRRD